MLFGMITQILCGNLTGHVASYELHVFFRCLSAICCAQMYTAGGIISKLIDRIFLVSSEWINLRWLIKNNHFSGRHHWWHL